jgi:hypothetical protein
MHIFSEHENSYRLILDVIFYEHNSYENVFYSDESPIESTLRIGIRIFS